MSKGHGVVGPAIATRELSLPEGEYIVLDDQGHEAYVPRRVPVERGRTLAGISIYDDV